MTITFTPTAAFNFVKIPQYVEEVSFNTPPASPTFKAVGNVTGIGPTVDNDVDMSRWLGSRDIQSQVQLGTNYGLSFDFKPTDIVFLKYGSEYPAGTGTNAKTLTFIWSELINGVEKYLMATGCICSKLSFAGSRKSGISVTQSFMPKVITNYLSAPAAPITTPTYATNPSVDPWSGITTVPQPLTINGAPYSISEFKFDVNQNPITLESMGVKSFDFAAAGNRDITLSFTTWSYDGTQIDNLTNFVAREVVLTLAVVAGVTYTASFHNVRFKSYKTNDSAGDNAFKTEAYDATANSMELTSST
jgi:hypothetical protein